MATSHQGFPAPPPADPQLVPGWGLSHQSCPTQDLVCVCEHAWACLCGVTEVANSLLCFHLPTLQAKNERNYHIFYELLAGLPAQLRQAFSLQEAETYYYLNQVSTSRLPGALGPGPPTPSLLGGPVEPAVVS